MKNEIENDIELYLKDHHFKKFKEKEAVKFVEQKGYTLIKKEKFKNNSIQYMFLDQNDHKKTVRISVMNNWNKKSFRVSVTDD